MKCSYHHNIDAIGLCRYCLRGVCPECAAEFPEGLACRGKHEESAKQLQSYVDSYAQRQSAHRNEIKRYSNQVILTTCFYLLIGGTLAAIGLRQAEDAIGLLSRIGFFIMGLALVNLVYGYSQRPRKFTTKSSA